MLLDWFLGKEGHSLSRRTVDPVPLFFVLSAIHVNIDKGLRIMDKPGNQKRSLVDLRGSRKYLRCVARASQPGTAIVLRRLQTCWKGLSTKPIGKTTTYRRSSSRRLCSATSFGRESKWFSNATIRERSPSILLPTATAPYNCACQRNTY
jgi:hypothetical protein